MSPHRLNDSTIGGPSASLKRSLDAPNTAVKPKRVRILRDDNDSPTEGESDDDLDRRRRRRAGSPGDDDDDDDDDDNDDNDEPLPPLPPPLPQSRISSVRSQGKTTRKGAHATSELAPPKTSSFPRPPTRTSTNPIASTSSNNRSTVHSLPFDAATYIARHPPPKDLNDIGALTLWAAQISKQQAEQGLGNAPSTSGSHPPTQRTTTASHIAQAIAGHRSQVDLSTCLSQSSSAGPTPHESSSNSNDTSSSNAGIASTQRKVSVHVCKDLSYF